MKARVGGPSHLVLLLASLALLAFTASAAAESRPPPSSRVTPALSRESYEALERAQKLVTNGRPADAAALLEELADRGNRYDRAVVRQSLGIALVAADQPERALAAFESALEEDALSQQAASETRLQIGQLQLRTGRIDAGIATLEGWLAESEAPPASAHVLLGNAYAQAARYAEAVGHVERGITESDAPPEPWLRLAGELHLALGDPTSALPFLERVVRTSVRASDWNRLVATHRALGDFDRALASAQLGAALGLRSSGAERLELIDLLQAAGRPLAAAAELEQGLADGTIEPTAQHQARLGGALRLARESDRAAEALARAAREGGGATVWLELGQLHVEAERWAEAEQALRRASDTTDDALRARASLRLGIVLLELGRLDEAATALDAAARHDGTRRAARSWKSALATRRDATAAAGR